MSEERFDHIARLLAQGNSRRQILKGFAAGLGASIFSVFGVGQNATHERIAHAAPLGGESFLPFIKGEGAARICSVASTCSEKVICSTDGNECRCLESAEGEILCGQIPSCGAQRCTTSADCANLGEGYFCDSVGSGCCDDEQRCIAPCDMVSPPPIETVVTGTWTGTLAYDGQSVGIRFVLAEEDGVIDGRILMQDPVSKEFLETGPITGENYEGVVYIYLSSGSYVEASFVEEGLQGSFFFTYFTDEDGFTAALDMQREAEVLQASGY